MLVRTVPHCLLVFVTLIYKVSCQGASLTFVIDKTGSMHDDIAQVRTEVDSIMDIVLDEKSSQISNIVLVTFDDPDKPELRIRTNNRDKLKWALDRVDLGWGRDCPELALGGLQLGLESSLPGSYIYVFTDASAKDYWMSEEIQQLCQRKQSQIIFVLTGDCGRPELQNFQVYYSLSTASSGLAIRVPKSEVNTILRNFLQEDIKGNKTGLTSQLTPAYVTTEVPFWIDDLTKYVIVSASGTNVHLYEFEGPSLTMETVIWTDHTKVVKLTNTKPGHYKAFVKSDSVSSVVISGRSDFYFRHGFSEQQPKTLDDTTPQPFSDTLTRLSLLVTDPNDAVRIQSAQILDMKENVIKEMPLTELWPNFYTTEQFVAPSHMFKVALTGKVIKTGSPIRRIAKIPVTPQKAPYGTPKAKAPVVEITEGASVEVARGSAVTLTCKVSAYPAPEITWRNELGIKLQSETSRVQIPYDYISYLKIASATEARYYCHARNYYNKQYKGIDVIIKDPFIINSVPKGTTTIAYGTASTLNCDVRSQQPLQIRWYYENKLTGATEHLISSKKYTTSSDGTQLKILSMDLDLVGKYTCKVFLQRDPTQKREFSTNVEINGLVPPKIDPETQIIKVKEHMPASVKCKILEGLPNPKISWQIKVVGSLEYRSIAGSGSELRIEKAALASGGHYKCIAKNVAGQREQVVAELMVLKAPAVTIVEGASMNVPYGSRLTLTCRVTANPEPTVAWKDSAGKSLSATSSATKGGFEYTRTITHANVKASGKYSCSASNDQGSTTESIQVSVSSPFNVHSYPPDSVPVLYGNKVNLKCDITSYLPMKIRWYRVKDSTREKTEIQTSKQYTILSYGAELKINMMDVGLDGKYACKASLLEDENEHVEYTTNVQIDGLEVPKIIGDKNRKVRVGASVSIKCNVVQGVPKPKVSWQFKHTDSGEYADINNIENEWYNANVTLEHSGFYTCTAKNSQGISTHTVELTVQEPAKITSEEFTVYEGIVGDIALRIPCETIGFPKPTIEWKVNGSIVTPGTKYVIENGALVIKYPERSDSNYTCTASNDAGSDSKTFRGVVDDTFTDYGIRHDVYILKGDSKNVTCSLPRSDSSSVKWFIEPQNITHVDTPYVTVKDAKLNDDGNYTCHVSDIHGSATETFSVDVGYPPTFKPSPQGSIVGWNGDTEDVLSCTVRAKPEANVEWTFNGKPVVGPLELNIFKWGHYKCNVSNVHGAVQKEFEVKPTACLISRKNKETSHMPLMLTEELTWPDFPTVGEYMIMKPGDKLMLSCHNDEKSPNSFRKFPALGELDTSCIKGDTFTVDGEPYQLQDLQCTNEIYPSVVKTNSKCLTETAEVIKVGYNIGKFVEAYEVCFDYARNIPLYTRVVMSKTNNIPSTVNKWFEYSGIGNGRAEAYTCKNSSSSCCYAKTQLASATDFIYGPAQNSSFIYPLNAIPNLRPCDLDRTTWDKVENIVRARLDVNPNIVVWSGVHTLHEEKNGAIIPRYLWKVVRESEDEAIAIVYVNVAAPTPGDIKCNNICAGGDGTWYSTSDKYTYCCKVDDFLEAFNIPGDVVEESNDKYGTNLWDDAVLMKNNAVAGKRI